METIVITGAAGFLGQMLMTHLANRELNIIPVSRRPLAGMYQVQDYTQSPAGDVLIHLAEEPDRSKVNHSGEKYLLDSFGVIQALSGRYQKIIYASSGVVYGDESEQPYKVNEPVFATDVYSRSKLLNEKIVLDSGGTVVRLSNLFGQGMSPNNVMSDIACQIPGEGPVKVRDDKPVRDFLSVFDAALAFGLIMKSHYNGIVNVGSGIATSIRALAELLLALEDQAGREIIATKPAFKQSINVLDISETKEIFGWSPSSSLKDQLSQFLQRNKVH